MTLKSSQSSYLQIMLMFIQILCYWPPLPWSYLCLVPLVKGFFSQQNILKSKLRNRLNPDRLNRLLMIRLNGPDEDMDFISAARAFGSMKDRQK